MHKITCTMITLNEAHCIGPTLDAVQSIADEIIVVDSGSTDDTLKIAEAKKAKIIHNDWVGYGPQKYFAGDQAKYDWILNLDADEVLTPGLIQEIQAWKESGNKTPKGFRMKIVTVYPNKNKPRFRADYNNYIRLYNRRFMRFSTSLTHDVVLPKDHEIGQFRALCYHYTMQSLEHLKMKYERYTDLQSTELTKQLWLLLIRWPFEYIFAFIKYYFFRGHVFGGLFGLRVALLSAGYRGRRIGKFINAHRKKKNLK